DRRFERAECRHEHDRQIGTRGDDTVTEIDPARTAHVEIRHDDVEVVFRELIERLVGGHAIDDVDPALSKREHDGLTHGLIVVDEQNRRHARSSFGRCTRNVLPFPISDSTSMNPLCSVTMPYATDKPRPVPPPTSFVVKNGSKMRLRCSSEIPTPE